MDYIKTAEQFLKKNNIRMSQKFIGEVKPDWDNSNLHNAFSVRFFNRNTKKSMTITFYGSRHDYDAGVTSVTAYDVLSCIQKYEVGTFDQFMSEFGYEINCYEDFKRIEKTYKAVKREVKGVMRVFADCLDELRDIS